MFTEQSTGCFLALPDVSGDHKHMVDAPGPGSTTADRLRYIVSACGYGSEAAFARALGKTIQNLTNWKRRNTFGKAQHDIRKLTGAAQDYLQDGTGIPFPNGPIMASPGVPLRSVVESSDEASLAQLVRRLEGDVDQLRLVLTMMLQAIPATTPALGEMLHTLLEKAAPKEYAEKGFQSLALLALETAQKAAATAPPGVRRRGAS